MILRLIPILVFLFTISCTRRNAEQVRAREIYDSAMHIHDEIMPMMDNLYRQQQRLKKILINLKQDSVQHAQKINEIQRKLDALDYAGDAMMDWMHEIKLPPGTGDELHQEPQMATAGADEQLIQKSKIEAVRDSMQSSIRNAAAVQE